MRRLLPLLLLLAGAACAGPADPDSLIWVSETAAVDSLNNYWRSLDSSWYEPLRLEDLGWGLTPARLDSLRAAGDVKIAGMLSGRPWRVSARPLARLQFNRVEGLSPGGEVELYRPGARQPRFVSGLSYGVASRRVSHQHGLVVPLITTRLRDAEGRLRAAPWTSLAFEARGGRETEWFAGDMRRERDMGAFFGGDDPNHYFEREHWRAGLRYTPRPWLSLLAGYGTGSHRPLGVATTWSLFGNRNEVPGNFAITPKNLRTFDLGTQVRWRGLWLQAVQEWSRLSNSPDPLIVAGDGSAWFRHYVLKAMWQEMDPLGNTWVLRGNWSSVDRVAPLEWKTWLGDHGSLRGYPARELVGDQGGWASLDMRWNLDPFRSLRMPLLKNLGLQPVTFVDFGRVHRRSDDTDGYPGGDGWRADLGFGFGRFVGMGGRLDNIRLYAAKPAGNGQGGRPWQVILAFEGW